MKRLVMLTLFPLILAGCGDDSAIPRPGQNMEQQVQSPPMPVQAKPTLTSPSPLTSSSSTNQESDSAPSFETEVKDAYGKAKQKTRKISGSLTGSAKNWKKDWTKMNKDRIKTDELEPEVVPRQEADLGALKAQANNAKEVVVDTGRVVVDKAKSLIQ
jgi:hypothetical protein